MAKAAVMVAMARMEATAAVVATASKGTRLWLAMGQNMDGALTNGVLGLIIKLDILRMTAVQLLLCAALAAPATTSFGVEEEEEEDSAAAPSSITDRNVGRGAGNCFGGEDADGVDDALTPMPADVQGAQRGDVGQLHQSVGGRAAAELPQAKGLEMGKDANIAHQLLVRPEGEIALAVLSSCAVSRPSISPLPLPPALAAANSPPPANALPLVRATATAAQGDGGSHLGRTRTVAGQSLGEHVVGVSRQ